MIPLSQALAWLVAYKYAILFPIALVEGPIITIMGGFLVAQHVMNFWLVYVLVIIGDLIGDAAHYVVGRVGREPVLMKGPRLFRVSEAQMQRIEADFQKHRARTLLVAKWTHGLGFAALLTAGVVGMDFWEFMGINFIGILPKSLALLLIGYYFGQLYAGINTYINNIALGMIVFFVLAIVAYFVYRKIEQTVEEKEL